MANLTYLNDASVFWNLKTRYQAKMIHTYSGLFVVVVNPYKRYPLYTHRVCKIYLGKRRNECPPHLWAIAEGAYRNMLQNKKNNAMLITGESGAGKTEASKNMMQYVAADSSGAHGTRVVVVAPVGVTDGHTEHGAHTGPRHDSRVCVILDIYRYSSLSRFTFRDTLALPSSLTSSESSSDTETLRIL